MYGVGICAQYGGALFAAQCGEALAVIHAMVNKPDARDEESGSGFATDNAISALGKIILHQVCVCVCVCARACVCECVCVCVCV